MCCRLPPAVVLKGTLNKVDRRTVLSDKNSSTENKKRPVIILEKTFNVSGRKELGHSNCKSGRDVGMTESKVCSVVRRTEIDVYNRFLCSSLCAYPVTLLTTRLIYANLSWL
jgi:hypothetical protein